MSTEQRILPALMAVVYGAALIATWGLTSLALDADVITEKDAGPLLGPAMAAAAILVTWFWLLRLRRATGLWGIAILAAASSWFAMLAVGSVGYTVTRGELTWLVLFAGAHAASPFLLVPAVLSGVVIVVARVLSGRSPEAKSFDRR